MEQPDMCIRVLETDYTRDAPSFILFRQWRFANTGEKLRVVIGMLSALVSGLTFPAMIILFGRITKSLIADAGEATDVIQALDNFTPPELCSLFLTTPYPELVEVLENLTTLANFTLT
jgi:hypothetical protein